MSSGVQQKHSNESRGGRGRSVHTRRAPTADAAAASCRHGGGRRVLDGDAGGAAGRRAARQKTQGVWARGCSVPHFSGALCRAPHGSFGPRTRVRLGRAVGIVMTVAPPPPSKMTSAEDTARQGPPPRQTAAAARFRSRHCIHTCCQSKPRGRRDQRLTLVNFSAQLERF